MTKAERAADAANAVEQLRRMVPIRARVATLLIQGSPGPQCRDYVRVFVSLDGAVCEITAAVARAAGRTYTANKRGIAVNGGGFDKGDDVVSHLAEVLYPDHTRANAKHPIGMYRSAVLNHDRL